MHRLTRDGRALDSAVAPLAARRSVAARQLAHRRFSGTLRHLRSASHPMPHSFKPTAEQHAVVDAVLGGGDLKIKAYAGAGKTSTLRLIGDHLPRNRRSYLAFNKEIPPTPPPPFPPTPNSPPTPS